MTSCVIDAGVKLFADYIAKRVPIFVSFFNSQRRRRQIFHLCHNSEKIDDISKKNI
jgi:hypothetical protein